MRPASTGSTSTRWRPAQRIGPRIADIDVPLRPATYRSWLRMPALAGYGTVPETEPHLILGVSPMANPPSAFATAQIVRPVAHRELEATTVETWHHADRSTRPTPKPLPPCCTAADPVPSAGAGHVRHRRIGHGRPPFGAGTFAVEAMHGDILGGYPLVMPMTTEQAVVGGRETYGEPKKLADVTLQRDGDSSAAGSPDGHHVRRDQRASPVSPL